MIAQIVIIITAALCGILAPIVYALSERTRKLAMKHLDSAMEAGDKIARLVEENNDTFERLSERMSKLSLSVGLSCDDMVDDLNKMLQTMSTDTAETKTWVAATNQAVSSVKPRNCPNCGAPVRGSECEYCGTVFTSSETIYEYEAKLPDNMDSFGILHEERTERRFNPTTHIWEWV